MFVVNKVVRSSHGHALWLAVYVINDHEALLFVLSNLRKKEILLLI